MFHVITTRNWNNYRSVIRKPSIYEICSIIISQKYNQIKNHYLRINWTEQGCSYFRLVSENLSDHDYELLRDQMILFMILLMIDCKFWLFPSINNLINTNWSIELRIQYSLTLNHIIKSIQNHLIFWIWFI